MGKSFTPSEACAELQAREAPLVSGLRDWPLTQAESISEQVMRKTTESREIWFLGQPGIFVLTPSAEGRQRRIAVSVVMIVIFWNQILDVRSFITGKEKLLGQAL